MSNSPDLTRLKIKGTVIVRDGRTGVAKFDCWDELPDETQRRFRNGLTYFERAIFPLRTPVEAKLNRGHNGFPDIDNWNELDWDTQAVLRGQMTEEEREFFPIGHANT